MARADLELPERLHLAARHYCLDRHAAWADTYARMTREGAGYNHASQTYSNRARDVFPRYLILAAIRDELERPEPDGFASVAAARAAVIAACERAEVDNPHVSADPISAAAIEDERASAIAHLAALDDDALWRVRPLPYCRVLAADELAALAARCTARFGTWYGGASDGRMTVAYRTFHLPLEPDPDPILRAVLRDELGIARVYAWHEVGPSARVDVDGLAFAGSETLWFTDALDLLIYASHEATLTIAGDELLPRVEARAPAWSARRAYGT